MYVTVKFSKYGSDWIYLNKAEALRRMSQIVGGMVRTLKQPLLGVESNWRSREMESKFLYFDRYFLH